MTKYDHWRTNCFKRDQYTCQHCETCGVELHVDHIKPFSLIIKENNILSVEDAFKCDELWDMNNGRTLCIECHRKTDTFGAKAKKLLVISNNKKG